LKHGAMLHAAVMCEVFAKLLLTQHLPRRSGNFGHSNRLLVFLLSSPCLPALILPYLVFMCALAQECSHHSRDFFSQITSSH
jgi:hypothetical protein